MVSVGHIGYPLPGLELKLLDLPEVNLYASRRTNGIGMTIQLRPF